MRALFIVSAFAVLCVFTGTPLMAQFILDVEGGKVYPGYNDVRIPGNTGTKLSLKDEVKTGSEWYYRVRAGWLIEGRHFVSVMAAPLSIRGSGSVDRDVNFDGTIFPAGTPLEAAFQFNTYRAGYRYDFFKTDRWSIGAGVTVLVRDAYIELEGGGTSAKKSNLGAAPLIHFRISTMLAPWAGIIVEGDGLASPQGRAFDILTGMVFPVSTAVTLKAGYRFLEGGSDNDEVYTFSLFHFASLGAEVRF